MSANDGELEAHRKESGKPARRGECLKCVVRGGRAGLDPLPDLRGSGGERVTRMLLAFGAESGKGAGA
ncbi:MAG TPA: hypothetical protein VEZ90_20160 [Blastocatellia bacterium]|nr:hypothetical protein [Blastocatellia bacterium]